METESKKRPLESEPCTTTYKYGSFQRIKPPPIPPQDLAILPRIPTIHIANFDEINKPLSQLLDLPKSPQLYYTDDHPQNRRGFRYSHCIANPLFNTLQYTAIEVAPFKGSVSYFDKSPSISIDIPNALLVSTTKGFVSARANLCIRQGHWYYETKIIKANDSTGSHVRLGLSRREASLEAPIGFDSYGYGLRDSTGQTIHLSRLEMFMNESFGTNDVVGFHVYLPPLPIDSTSWLFRDRIPIKYKGQMYFENLEYQPTKEMEELIIPLSTTKSLDIPKLKGSFIKVYKNGKFMGTAFNDLNSFLPPNSKQHQLNSRNSTHSNSPDDGLLGYFPTISVFKGGMAQFNFGPNFDFLPNDIATNLSISRCSGLPKNAGLIRPLCERYEEQIAEDILQDIIDQVDFELQI